MKPALVVLTLRPSHGLHCLCWALLMKAKPKEEGFAVAGDPLCFSIPGRDCWGLSAKFTKLLAGTRPHWLSACRSCLSSH